jgi:hypothetical protein
VSELWLPGSAGPLDQFVERLQRRIKDYAERNGRVAVEVELADGANLAVKEISPEPGFGFVTLTVFPEEQGEAEEELIVPIGSVRRVTLGKPDEQRSRFGFTPPAP